MSERYKRLIIFDEKQWAAGCPLLFLKGALLHDTRTDKNILQLKFQSLCQKRIKAFEIRYDAYSLGDEKLESKKFSYLDLSLRINDVAGENVPIYLDMKESRRFKFTVAAVFYEDGSSWTGDAELKKIEEQVLIKEGLGNNLSQQFKREYLEKSNRNADSFIYMPVFKETYWLCSCGALNNNDSFNCRECRITSENLRKIYDEDYLHNNLQEYIQKEEEKRKREEQERKEFEIKKKEDQIARRKEAVKYIRLLLIFAVIGIAIKVSTVWYKKVYIPDKMYSSAESSFASGDYQTAINRFTELGDYKESKNRLLESRYNLAKKYMEEAKYPESIEAFKKIEKYKDAGELMAYCDRSIRYNEAVSYASAGQYEAALIKIKALPEDFLDKQKLELQYIKILSKTYFDAKDYESTYKLLKEYDINNHLFKESCYQIALSHKKRTNYDTAMDYFRYIINYKNSKAHIRSCQKALKKESD